MAARRWHGSEPCGFCLQVYVVELEVYCAVCDRPVCPLCAIRGGVVAEPVCPECAAAPGESHEEAPS